MPPSAVWSASWWSGTLVMWEKRKGKLIAWRRGRAPSLQDCMNDNNSYLHHWIPCAMLCSRCRRTSNNEASCDPPLRPHTDLANKNCFVKPAIFFSKAYVSKHSLVKFAGIRTRMQSNAQFELLVGPMFHSEFENAGQQSQRHLGDLTRVHVAIAFR